MVPCTFQAACVSAQQTVPTNVTGFGFSTSNVTVYGQVQNFLANLTVPPLNPLPTGSINFQNNAFVFLTAPLASTGVAYGNNLVSTV
jgi:hypothetical protein